MAEETKVLTGTTTKTEKAVIECDCGTHLLAVQSEIDFFDCSTGERFNQEFYLSMFSYGNNPSKIPLWARIKNAWDHLVKGTLFRDQVCLTPNEAQKLADFINVNKFTGEAKTN